MKRLLLFFLSLVVASTAQTKRAFTIEDVYRVKSAGSLSLSPDGRSVLYTVSTTDLPRAKRTTTIWMSDADGGNARELTHGDADSSPHFSPDGKTISFVRGGNLYLLPLGGGAAKQLTKISTGVSDPLWAPDGTSVPLPSPPAPAGPGGASNHDPEPASSTNTDLWVIDLKTPNAAPRDITAANHSYDDSPLYSPDGRYLAYRTQTTPAYESALFQLAIYDRQTGTSKIVSGKFDDWIDDFRWIDPATIVFTGPVEGHNPLYRLDVASGAIAKIFDDQTIDAFEVAPGGNLFYIHRSVDEPSEIFRASIAGGAKRRLTHLNDAFANEVDIRPAEAMWVEGAQGQKVQVYVVKPHNFDPAKKYPLILNVHGGPQSQFGASFRADWQGYPGAR